MEKKITNENFWYTIMKITSLQVFLALTFTTGIFANTSAQEMLNKQVSLKMVDTSLRNIVSEISKSSGVRITYNSKILPKELKGTLVVDKAKLSEVLNQLLRPYNISYLVSNNQIILRKPLKAAIKTLKSRLELSPVIVDREIRGTVTDESGEGLSGVNVVVKGTTRGTITDIDGKYKLNIPDGNQTLVFRFVGYIAEEIVVGTQTQVDMILKEDKQILDEVVVIGYGTKKMSEVTGSISNVSGSAIADKPVLGFESALAGRATGVNLSANQGVPNQAPVFRIRGTNSLSLSSYPLVVVDGVPMYTEDINVGGQNTNNPLTSINPADIESIDIAKDAAATSIYGSRAANGVVFITTKSGKKGAAKLNYDVSYGLTKAARLAEVMNAEQYLEIKNEGLRNAGTYDPVSNYYGTSIGPDGKEIDTNWYDEIFRTGSFQTHNLNFSGGNEKTRYYFSTGYTENKGIIKANNFNRKSIDFNVNHKANNWLSVGLKSNYSYNKTSLSLSTGQGVSTTSAGTIAYRLAFINAPIVGTHNQDGSLNLTGAYLGVMDNEGHLRATRRLGYANPIMEFEQNRDNTANNFIQASGYVEIRPLEWITLKSLYGINNMYSRTERYQGPGAYEGQGDGGRAYGYSAKRETSLWTNTATLAKSFAQNNFDLLLGIETQEFKGNQFGIKKSGQSDPFYSNLQGGFSNVTEIRTNGEEYYNYLLSKFSRLQYDFNGKYFATASIREDESSVLGSDNKSGTFWGFSGAWQISKEGFWSESGISNVLNSLRLNASYGKVGNIGGVGDFASLATYSGNLYGGTPGLYFSASGNPDLKWETSKKLDIGIEFSMINHRLTGNISYYKNNIDGLIFSVPVSSSVGLPGDNINSVLSNVGSMFNRGWEVSLSDTPIQKESFTWNSSLNISFNKNEITGLAQGVDNLLINAGAGMNSISMVGSPVGMIFAIRTDGVDPATGRRIFLDASGRKVLFQQVVPAGDNSSFQWEYEDGSQASPVSTSRDGIPYKSPHPKVFGGFSNSFNIGNFDISALITYQLGGYMYFATQASLMDMRFQNNSTKVLDRWQNPGDITDVPKVIDGDITSWGYSTPLTANVYKTDFARLQNLTVAYRLPSNVLDKVKLNSVRVYVSGQNLALLTKYPGSDPETTSTGNSSATQGFDKNMTPNARTYVVGLQVGF